MVIIRLIMLVCLNLLEIILMTRCKKMARGTRYAWYDLGPFLAQEEA